MKVSGKVSLGGRESGDAPIAYEIAAKLRAGADGVYANQAGPVSGRRRGDSAHTWHGWLCRGSHAP